jgi:hypothetical protein
VHEDFAAVGPTPAPLTRLQEWSEKGQERHDAWNARRKAKDEELKKGRYGKIHEEIRKLHQQRGALKEEAKRKELDTRIAALHKEARALWEKTMRSAGVFGHNPYPGGGAAEMNKTQRSLVYHATADWDDKVHGEASGKAPPKRLKWLKDVRGF